jgi:undecaprenyl diphosphate synthase
MCASPYSLSETIYFPEETAVLDQTRIPTHIALIPDGNRRWARERNSSSEEGHKKGADTIMDIVKASKELGIKAITFYLFSTENWKRSKEEFTFLMWLLQSFLNNQKKAMLEKGIRLQTIGDLTRLPASALQTIRATKDATAHCDKIEMILALNYGGRDDICRAVRKLTKDVLNGTVKEEEITESLISSYLDTTHWKDPDLLIRTSGELRISNFLLWQISYSEIYVKDVLWPDFTPKHLLEAIVNFQARQRRHGGA